MKLLHIDNETVYARDANSKALIATNKEALLSHRKRNRLFSENKDLKAKINTMEERLAVLEKAILKCQ